VRVIAATNRDLEKEVEAGRFVVTFGTDSTRFLSWCPRYGTVLKIYLYSSPGLWRDTENGSGKRFDMIPQKTIKALQSYSWPGNIRELENLIERAVITSPEERFSLNYLRP